MEDNVYPDIKGFQIALFSLADGKRAVVDSVFLTELTEEGLASAAKLLLSKHQQRNPAR